MPTIDVIEDAADDAVDVAEAEASYVEEEVTSTDTQDVSGEVEEVEDTVEGSVEAEAEDVISIGDTPLTPTTKAPAWVQKLRKDSREDKKRIRELEQQLKAPTSPYDGVVPLGAMPRLEDFDYEATEYQTALQQYYERKQVVDAQAKQLEAAEQVEKAKWQSKVDHYNKAKTALKVKDYEEAEFQVLETFSTMQQSVILQGAENPALVVYALGKNAEKAKELAAITDTVAYAFAVAKLESQLKVSSKKSSAPPPESVIRGSAPISSTVDSQLERLRKEAAVSGDYTKVAAYKRSKRST